jgi:peroxiredoxin
MPHGPPPICGSLAPDFSATSHENKTVKLSDFEGKKLLLWFYPRASTGGWTDEGLAFQALLHNFTKAGCAVVGCSNDSVEKNKTFSDAQGFTYPLLCDEDLSVAAAYGAALSAEEGGPKAKRVAALIDKGKLIKYFDPAGKGEFPCQALKVVEALI